MGAGAGAIAHVSADIVRPGPRPLPTTLLCGGGEGCKIRVRVGLKGRRREYSKTRRGNVSGAIASPHGASSP
jgi:hypothetical protein